MEEPIAGGNGNVQFTIQLPGSLATRAFATGADKVLSYAVYEKGTKNLIESETKVAFQNGLSTTVQLQLANGKGYDIIFWADKADNSPYTFSTTDQTITVDYTGVKSTDDSRDAFFGQITFDVNGPVNEKVELKRPFAQINLGTDDLDAASIKSEYYTGTDPDLTLSLAVDLKAKAYKTLNLMSGAVSDQVDVTFDKALASDCIKNGGDFPYTPAKPAKAYSYISMDYILVAPDRDVVDLTYAFYNSATAAEAVTTLPVASVPVQRNYQTNIFGSLLTSPANLTVEIKPAFDGTENREVIPASVATAADLSNAIASGATDITVTQDLDLTGPLDIRFTSTPSPIRTRTDVTEPQEITINLNGRTISLDNIDKAFASLFPSLLNPNAYEYYTAAIRLAGEGVVVNIVGPGTIEAGTHQVAAVFDKAVLNIYGDVTCIGGRAVPGKGSINFNGNTYNYDWGTNCDEQGNVGTGCIYAKGGTINIYDGYYEMANSFQHRYGVLNCNDKDGGYIYTYGGTVVGLDPIEGDNVYKPSSWLPKGYKSTKTSITSKANKTTVDAWVVTKE